MQRISDKYLGIIISHTDNWSGEATISWLADPSGRSAQATVLGMDLVAGRCTLDDGIAIPAAVLIRATALAVENYILRKVVSNAEQIGIPR